MGDNGKKRHCNHCNMQVDTVVEVLSSGPHYGKENCVVCGRFTAFTKKPENSNKRDNSKYKPIDLGFSYCQICQRDHDRLGSRGVLEVHHVIEVQHGGEDAQTNIWIICTSCHKLVHHQRRYLKSHMKGYFSYANLQKQFEKDNVPPSLQRQMARIFQLAEDANDQ